MKTVLLTGGSGFIGRNICESYLNDKYIIISPTSRELNLVDEKSVDQYFSANKIDIVIHAAVKPSHRNAKDLNDIFYSNTRMFFNLERKSDQFEKMLVLGSGAVYDMRYYHPHMLEFEYTKHIPADDHGYCKYVCSKMIEHSANIYDLRLFGVFGKYEDYAIRFISNAICKSLFDLPITIKQNRRFDYLFIDDLMPVIEWFIENSPQKKIYNVTSNEARSLYDIASLVKRISKKVDLPIIVAQERMGLEYSGDNSGLKTEFLDLSFTPFDKSLKSLYEWYEFHKDIINVDLLLEDK